MKRIILVLSIIVCHLLFSPAGAQTARQVLDKTAAAVTNKDGVTANFKLTNNQGSISGTIAVKGQKFHATTAHGMMWFDGKTQWTYMKKNDEVNVNNPSEAELQAINPYNFINMYKNGFKYTMTSNATSHNVHLTATNPKRKVQEMFIIVDKKSYAPTQVKMLQGKNWTTFDITNLKKEALSDALFRFNSKDFPTAEVIDLR
jgi:outer membrane lipoprotein-sorting protein